MTIVAIAAAIGSFVHIANSFATFIGNGQFDARWLWWYTLRIPIGVALALVVYLAIRGGLLTASALSTSDINPFGIASLSGLVGLFSKEAADKLEETFKALFRTGPGVGDDIRGDKLQVLKPIIDKITPSTFSVTTAPSKLIVTGTNFIFSAIVTIDDAKRKVDRIDGQNLVVEVESADIHVGTLTLKVINLTPAGSASASQTVVVTP